MKVRLFLILAALFCSCVSGCTRVRYMKEVSQVSYTEESGTILPEVQLYEQIVITRNKVTLTRNGKTADTEVNEGTWEFEVDEQEVVDAGYEKAIEIAKARGIKIPMLK